MDEAKLKGYVMLEQLIDAAVKRGATDIQFISEKHAFRVFERVDGVRRLVGEYNKEHEKSIIARVKDRSVMDLTENTKEQFGEFEFGVGTAKIGVCAAIFVDEEGQEGAQLSFVKRPFKLLNETTKNAKSRTEQYESRGSLEIGM
jgi:type II secretory ATPase GspE/PulE/Tfp pilus assembly ATPase PilB-like protein